MAGRTAEALQKIVSATGKVTELIAEIAAASNEQAQGVTQITKGLGHVDLVTQQNTAHAEEGASAAEELSSQALLLQQLVSAFKVNETAALHSAEAAQAGPGRQRMLGQGTVKAQGAAKPKPAAPWGGATAGNHTPEPVIALDDREFGKY